VPLLVLDHQVRPVASLDAFLQRLLENIGHVVSRPLEQGAVVGQEDLVVRDDASRKERADVHVEKLVFGQRALGVEIS